MSSKMSVVVVIEVEGVDDLDGVEADNAIECITDAMKSADLPGEWRIEEVFGNDKEEA